MKIKRFGHNIIILLISVFLTAIPALFFSCDSKPAFVLGDERDILEDLKSGHSTEYVFFAENPQTNPNAKFSYKSHELGTTVDADSFFPDDLIPGYRAGKWNYYDEKLTSVIPENIKMESGEIKSVYVTLQPLCFYADRWIYNSEVTFSVHHLIQNTDLSNNYSLYETEKFKGLPETIITGTDYIKNIPGVKYSSSTNSVITEDGLAEIYIFYDRETVTITIKSEEGTFKNNPTQTEISYTGVYGTQVPALPDFEKTHFIFQGFKKDGGSEILSTLDTFPAEDTVYTVQWVEMSKSIYTVRHWLQKIYTASQSDNSVSFQSGGKTYYKDYEKAAEITLADYAGEMTAATFASNELISNIGNYAPAVSSITQKQIMADGTTVIDVYYDLIPITLVLDANGGTGTVQSQDFFTETNCITLMKFADTGFVPQVHYIFDSWNTKPDGSGTKYGDENVMIFTSETTFVLYAQWKEIPKVSYKVHHLLQKVKDTAPTADESIYGNTGTFVSGGKTYYTYYVLGAEESLKDYPSENTSATLATTALINNIANYKSQYDSADDIVQKSISSDGSTVVDICYTVKEIKVTLNLNGGKDTSGNQILEQNFCTESDCITLGTPTALGFENRKYRFTGWNTAADGSGTPYANEEVFAFTGVPDSQITIYAQWEMIVSQSGFNIVLAEPEDTSITVDDKVSGQITIIVTVPTGATASSYKWLVDDAVLSGATSDRIVITNTDYSYAYHPFSCIVTTTDGKIYVSSGGFIIEP